MPQRVLIVDDERKIVQLLAGYFRQAGFEALTLPTMVAPRWVWRVASSRI